MPVQTSPRYDVGSVYNNLQALKTRIDKARETDTEAYSLINKKLYPKLERCINSVSESEATDTSRSVQSDSQLTGVDETNTDAQPLTRSPGSTISLQKAESQDSRNLKAAVKLLGEITAGMLPYEQARLKTELATIKSKKQKDEVDKNKIAAYVFTLRLINQYKRDLAYALTHDLLAGGQAADAFAIVAAMATKEVSVEDLIHHSPAWGPIDHFVMHGLFPINMGLGFLLKGLDIARNALDLTRSRIKKALNISNGTAGIALMGGIVASFITTVMLAGAPVFFWLFGVYIGLNVAVGSVQLARSIRKRFSTSYLINDKEKKIKRLKKLKAQLDVIHADTAVDGTIKDRLVPINALLSKKITKLEQENKLLQELKDAYAAFKNAKDPSEKSVAQNKLTAIKTSTAIQQIHAHQNAKIRTHAIGIGIGFGLLGGLSGLITAAIIPTMLTLASVSTIGLGVAAAFVVGLFVYQFASSTFRAWFIDQSNSALKEELKKPENYISLSDQDENLLEGFKKELTTENVDGIRGDLLAEIEKFKFQVDYLDDDSFNQLAIEAKKSKVTELKRQLLVKRADAALTGAQRARFQYAYLKRKQKLSRADVFLKFAMWMARGCPKPPSPATSLAQARIQRIFGGVARFFLYLFVGVFVAIGTGFAKAHKARLSKKKAASNNAISGESSNEPTPFAAEAADQQQSQLPSPRSVDDHGSTAEHRTADTDASDNDDATDASVDSLAAAEGDFGTVHVASHVNSAGSSGIFASAAKKTAAKEADAHQRPPSPSSSSEY